MNFFKITDIITINEVIHIRNKLMLAILLMGLTITISSHFLTLQPLSYYDHYIIFLFICVVALCFVYKKKYTVQIMYVNVILFLTVITITSTNQTLHLSNFTVLFMSLIICGIYQNYKITILSGVIILANFNYLLFFNPGIYDLIPNFDTEVTPIFVNITIIITVICLLAQAIVMEKLRKVAENMAYKDSLTELPNRLKFNLDIQDSFRHIQDEKKMHEIALLIIDLDNFKKVNDTFGHDIGDQLLSEIAKRLKKYISDEVSIARLAGDEFILYITNNKPSFDLKYRATMIAEEVISHIQRDLTIDGMDVLHACDVTASIGISFAPTNARDWETLYKQADQSLYHSKSNGKNQYRVFNELEESQLV